MRKSVAKYLKRLAIMSAASKGSPTFKKHKFKNKEGKTIVHKQLIDPSSTAKKEAKRLWNDTPRPQRHKLMQEIKSKLGIDKTTQ